MAGGQGTSNRVGGDLEPLSPIPARNLWAKRGLDLVLGVPLAIAAVPVLGAIWAGYKLSAIFSPRDRGPVFFKVIRHANGCAVPIYKVRVSPMKLLDEARAALDDREVDTLVAHLDSEDQEWARRHRRDLVEDPAAKRTKMGALFRAVYLDELPQVLNVLRGDLSLVGPRPLALDDARARPNEHGVVVLAGEEFDYRHRDLLPGGLTGLYQTSKSADAHRDYQKFVQEGVALDRDYYQFLLEASPLEVVFMDLKILWRTVRTVLEHQGV